MEQHLPIRAVAEAVGKDIEWNQSTMTANIVEKNNIDTSPYRQLPAMDLKRSVHSKLFGWLTVGFDTKKNDVPDLT